MKILLSRFLLMILFLFPFFIKGNNVSIDSSDVLLKKIDTLKIKSYRADKDFLYDRVPAPPENWWEALKRIFWEWFSQTFEQSGAAFIWDYLKWMLLALAIGFMLLRIFKTSLRGLFQSKSATSKLHFITEDEDINEISFEENIAKAIQQRNYKEAIRLSYLSILKQLSDKALIEWKADKTNLDYVSEIKDKMLKEEFKKGSILFDYIWYGEFELKENEFNEAFVEFNKLNEKLAD